jgi:iron complex transport system ATP-binding protein
MSNTTYLHTENLSIGYKTNTLLSGLNLTISKGEMLCLIGANGVGKSTLIRSLLGLNTLLTGHVYLNGTMLEKLSLKDLAKQVSIVLTNAFPITNFSVYEMVALGRTPHTNWLGKLSSEDEKQIEMALDLVHLTSFSSRQVSSLSDGEKQRVMIAKALTQDTNLIVLDEPTAHLDIPNRVALLSLLKKLAKETGKAILLSTHELELALQISDRIWLIDNNKRLHQGTPEDIALTGKISSTFQNKIVHFDLDTGTFKMNFETNNKALYLESKDPNVYFWTRQALEKQGYTILEEKANATTTIIYQKSRWLIHIDKKQKIATSIEELLTLLSSD